MGLSSLFNLFKKKTSEAQQPRERRLELVETIDTKENPYAPPEAEGWTEMYSKMNKYRFPGSPVPRQDEWYFYKTQHVFVMEQLKAVKKSSGWNVFCITQKWTNREHPLFALSDPKATSIAKALTFYAARDLLRTHEEKPKKYQCDKTILPLWQNPPEKHDWRDTLPKISNKLSL